MFSGLELLCINSMLFHPFPKRDPADSEQTGSPGSVAAGLLQGLNQSFSFPQLPCIGTGCR
jgi:hypothetical protein